MENKWVPVTLAHLLQGKQLLCNFVACYKNRDEMTMWVVSENILQGEINGAIPVDPTMKQLEAHTHLRQTQVKDTELHTLTQ
jgi:hypothetical protein